MTSVWLMVALLGVAQPHVREAVQALETGHDLRADALAQRQLQHLGALPSDDDVVTLKLVRAFARLHGGNPKDALSGLDLLGADHIELGTQGLALRAHVLARMDACQEALCAAKKLPDASVWALAAWTDVAACMLHHNPTLPVHHPMPEGVREVRDALVRRGGMSKSPQDAAHSLLLAGRLTSAWGDALGADALFAQIVDQYGSLTDGHRARSERLALRKSGRVAGKLGPKPQLIDPEALRRLLMSRTERQALRHDALGVRALAPHDSAAYAQATLHLARLDQVEHQYASAQSLLTALLRQPLSPELRATAACLLGDVAAVRGHPDLAAGFWQQAVQACRTAPYGTLAALHAAAALLARHDLDQAQEQLAIVEGRGPLPEPLLVVRDDGVATVVTGATVRAEVARIKALVSPEPSADSITTWALAAISKTPAAPPAQPAVVGTPAAVGPTPPSGRPHLEAPDLAAIELLIDHHLPKEARALMRLLPAQDLNDGQRLVAAYLYARLGDTFRATLLMQHCDERCRALDPAWVALAYPRPYTAEVTAQSLRAHIPPALVYAIMREESGFNPGARSPRGAAGLMQLMPQTAQHLAQQAHVPVHSRAALLKPETSIALGAQLLGQLYRHFHGNIAAVAAAYQAGQPKAQAWLSQAVARGAQGRLTEVIPLASSRTYVEHIESAFKRYQQLQAAPAGRGR